MVIVLGEFRLPPEHRARALPLMARAVAATLAEDGCLRYCYAEDVCEPGLFRVSERWRDRQSLAAHLATPHMAQWRAEREKLGFGDLQIAVHEAQPGEPL